MKRLSFLAAILAGIITISMTWMSPDHSTGGRTLPNVVLKRLNGETVNIQEYGNNGKITVISFWASWCAPCKRELDAVAELYPEWQEKFNVEVLAVTVDNARALAKVRPIIEQKGWTFEILSDANQELQQALNFQAIPQTYVVDKTGEIVYEHSGYQPGDEYELEEVIAGLEK
ncbi:MAG TPA: TlpA disulfide reductase family protein [Saprospiraceae bacterium]|nr:TlpA disulfide reductase family protein [Saprospiraceae bacterium]